MMLEWFYIIITVHLIYTLHTLNYFAVLLIPFTSLFIEHFKIKLSEFFLSFQYLFSYTFPYIVSCAAKILINPLLVYDRSLHNI